VGGYFGCPSLFFFPFFSGKAEEQGAAFFLPFSLAFPFVPLSQTIFFWPLQASEAFSPVREAPLPSLFSSEVF